MAGADIAAGARSPRLTCDLPSSGRARDSHGAGVRSGRRVVHRAPLRWPRLPRTRSTLTTSDAASSSPPPSHREQPRDEPQQSSSEREVRCAKDDQAHPSTGPCAPAAGDVKARNRYGWDARSPRETVFGDRSPSAALRLRRRDLVGVTMPDDDKCPDCGTVLVVDCAACGETIGSVDAGRLPRLRRAVRPAELFGCRSGARPSRRRRRSSTTIPSRDRSERTSTPLRLTRSAARLNAFGISASSCLRLAAETLPDARTGQQRHVARLQPRQVAQRRRGADHGRRVVLREAGRHATLHLQHRGPDGVGRAGGPGRLLALRPRPRAA